MLARCILNYDFTFLAILLLEQEEDHCAFRCACKGFCKKSRITSSPALERAADETVILTYWKLQDEIEDSGFWRAAFARRFGGGGADAESNGPAHSGVAFSYGFRLLSSWLVG